MVETANTDGGSLPQESSASSRSSNIDLSKSTALHAVFGFIIGLLVTLVGMKYYGSGTTPFLTHPRTMYLFISASVFYTVAALAEITIGAADNNFNLFRYIYLISGLLACELLGFVLADTFGLLGLLLVNFSALLLVELLRRFHQQIGITVTPHQVTTPINEDPEGGEVQMTVQTSESSDENPVIVVLDLDETLVCAYETSSVPAIVRTQATDAGLKWFEIECVSSDKDSDGKPKISYVTVFERPGLHEFLKQIGEFADLVLFTAGLEGYARPLVDRIDVENRFKFRLYRPSTVTTEKPDHVKDISCISKDLCRIVIVDNNPFSFVLQPLNGVPCIPFSAGHPYDDQSC